MIRKPEKLEWFTPAPDVLIDRYGNRIIALVWGKIWRYCQMKDGKCSASITRMSDELGITEKTFRKYLHELITDEYIKDLTPNVRYRPHIYVVTDKLSKETKEWVREKGELEVIAVEVSPIKEAGNKCHEGGNNYQSEGILSPVSREFVPSEQGEYTDKDSINIDSKIVNNIVKDITSEVGETKTKNVSPTSQASISIRESIENNLSDYSTAIQAEGDTDETSRLISNGKEKDYKHSVKKERHYGLKTKNPESTNQNSILRKFGLTEFPTFFDKYLFIRLEKRINGNELEDMILRSYSDAVDLEEALSNLYRRARELHRKKSKQK